MDHLTLALAQAIIFSLVGIGVVGLALWVITKLTPFSIRKEIEDDQNVALGIIMGSVVIGLSIIIAASIHG
jgi:putative membrane protein